MRAPYTFICLRPRNKRMRSQDPDTWPIYGREPAMVLRRLRDSAHGNGTGTVNLSPRRVAEILGPPADDPGRAPEILNGLLWEWVKTTTPPEGEAPVEPYFSGIAAPEYSVSLIWRVHVPEHAELLWPRATDREAVDVPLNEAREVFGDDEELRRLGPDGVTIETVAREDTRPGDVIVLASDRGLLDRFGWDSESSSPVLDMSIADSGLPLDAEAIRRLCGVSVGHLVSRSLGIVADDDDVDEADRAEAVEQILDAMSAATPIGWDDAEWRELIAALERRVVTGPNEVGRLPRRDAQEPRSDELDEMSRADTAVDLERHNNAVAARSRTIAERLGLSADLAAAVERAGRAHDLGKADRRFQRWLDPDGRQPGPVAKSQMPRSRWNEARVAAAWPRGGRHEELSARLVRRWLEAQPDRFDPPMADLLVHLIVSHHGTGRPLVMPVEDHTTDTVSLEIEGTRVDAAADLSMVDWSQPARFQTAQRSVRAMGAGSPGGNRASRRPRGFGGIAGERVGGPLMATVICPGLPASWLNAWLAAVGATVLDSRIRLHWTTEKTPTAVLTAEGVDPVAILAESWPTTDQLAALPIAEHWNDTPPLPRKVSVDAFVARVRAARGHPYAWTLSSTMTDLAVDENGEVAHAPFDPAGPGTIKWLHHRLLKVHREVEPSARRIDGFVRRQGDKGQGQRFGIRPDQAWFAIR